MRHFARKVVDVVEDVCDVHVLRKQSAYHWPKAEFERRLFDRFQPDCVFDVGANIGQYADELRTIAGFEGTILSFEPNPSAFRQIPCDPKWFKLPYALGSEAGKLPLLVTESDSFASFLNPNRVARQIFPEQTVITEQPQADVFRLADVYAGLKQKYGFKRPFLKMDTQGFDLEVLKGSGDVLNEFVGILSEVALTPLYEGSPTFETSINQFNQSGFGVVGLFDVHASDRFTETLECDCFCVRKDLLDRYH